KHIPQPKDGPKDFTEVIEMAKTLPAPTELETGKIVGGFAHHQVLQLADKVVDAVKSGAIKKFVVMAGGGG
ncbi:MAG TPA: hydroxylamine reductase, partial [Candidatus Cloacimonas sp.]|nr:hydroxylamine reductase [Candidatus Cloacimonas sp.]